VQWGQYTLGITATGTAGQTCLLTSFNNSSTATATIYLTGVNTIDKNSPLKITAAGTGATSAPTSAAVSSGTATCSGTATLLTALGAFVPITVDANGNIGGTNTCTTTPGCVLYNGTTATTQSPGDNTTKVATDAFVLANVGGGSGTVSGQAVNVIGKATGTTTTGAQSSITDTGSAVNISEPTSIGSVPPSVPPFSGLILNTCAQPGVIPTLGQNPNLVILCDGGSSWGGIDILTTAATGEGFVSFGDSATEINAEVRGYMNGASSGLALFARGNISLNATTNHAAQFDLNASSATFTVPVLMPTIGTATNCSSSASPAVCAAAAAGSVALPTNAVSSSVVVNTTAITASSQIFVTTDDTLGTKLGVTCNSTVATLVGGLTISARTAGTSFTIANNVAVVTNPLCVSYFILN
jgi:hypothetical protein